MKIALIIGKDQSIGVPGKNTRLIMGRPSAEYACIAAKYANVEKFFTYSKFVLQILIYV